MSFTDHPLKQQFTFVLFKESMGMHLPQHYLMQVGILNFSLMVILWRNEWVNVLNEQNFLLGSEIYCSVYLS